MATNPNQLPVPRNRHQLEPFYSVFLDLVVVAALDLRLFENSAQAAPADLKHIRRKIESRLSRKMGHPVAPAIYVHALQVCNHFLYSACAVSREADRARHQATIDEAYCLLKQLELQLGLNDVYLRV